MDTAQQARRKLYKFLEMCLEKEIAQKFAEKFDESIFEIHMNAVKREYQSDELDDVDVYQMAMKRYYETFVEQCLNICNDVIEAIKEAIDVYPFKIRKADIERLIVTMFQKL